MLNRLILFNECAGVSTALPYALQQKRFRRRTLKLPPWAPEKRYSFVNAVLAPEQREHLEKHTEFDYLRERHTSREQIIESQPIEEGAEWTPESKRCGLIARKIGMAPQWLNDGTRVLCTMLEIPSNHVIQVLDPDTWYKNSLLGKRKAFNRFGPRWQMTIGAVDIDPTFVTPGYRKIFEQNAVPCKDRKASFVVTEDAAIKAGTRLDVRHFTVGQFVNVSGKTIDWGFQGVMHRWGMRGQPQNRTTKSHRRVGSIGSTGDARVWPGRRLPGHMGFEWRLVTGLLVLRVNPLKQILYVKGAVPGDLGEYLLVNDCINDEKRKTVKNPPFPTFVPAEDDVHALEGDVPTADLTKHDLYHPRLFRFSSPSIVYTEAHETPPALRDKSRAKIAKAKK